MPITIKTFMSEASALIKKYTLNQNENHSLGIINKTTKYRCVACGQWHLLVDLHSFLVL